MPGQPVFFRWIKAHIAELCSAIYDVNPLEAREFVTVLRASDELFR
jgi:hypothetical protein